MAYGSGVMKQAGSRSSEPPMLDLMFAVSNASEWHRDNLALNRQDYASPLSLLSGAMIANFQETGGAKILYHPYVDAWGLEPGESEQPIQLKYGVISADDVATDLKDWTTLFCSGRLHKPAVVLQQTPHFRSLLRNNLESALHTSLLLLPSEFSEHDLYVTIAGLSYTGDPRFTVGAESSTKVNDLVGGNFGGFQALYNTVIDRSDWVERVPGTGINTATARTQKVCQERSQKLLCRSDKWRTAHMDNAVQKSTGIIRCLPHNLRRNMVQSNHEQTGAAQCVSVETWRQQVTSGLARIVQRTMVVQNIKNLVAAGMTNSIKYVLSKLQKGRKSRKPTE